MKVSIYNLLDFQKEYFEKNLDGFEVSTHNESAAGDTKTEIISVFVESKLPKEILEKFPKLKFIATRSTGFDHIDLNYCKEKGIKVSNVPSYGENTVAEHAFALLLAISKKIPWSVERTHKSDFDYVGLRGFDLKGKTLGVIGTGKIGKYSIKIAKGFGMEVIAYDAFPNEELSKELGFKYVNLDELLGESDVITIHVPLLPETRHMINKENISKIKKGAVLINTARGEIVETEALISALKDGTIAFAGLDVLEGEKNVKEHIDILSRETQATLRDYKTLAQDQLLMDMKNVIVTPHSAFNTTEAIERIFKTTMDNIKAFAEGKPINLVEAKEDKK